MSTIENPTEREKDINNLGRFITKFLRHELKNYIQKIKITEDGFIKVSDLLSLDKKTRSKKPLNEYTPEDVIIAVEKDNKNRMTYKIIDGILMIRANQGYSFSEGFNPEKIYKKITNTNQLPIPGLAIHGTSKKYISAIIKNGLNPMKRTHIHFSTQEYGSSEMISGMRKSSEVLIYLDVEKVLDNNIPLYLSENQVLLCPEIISSEYFKDIRYI